uniref:Disease resistance N-terminal domain-containing protein n=1 Tax=Fagus sylvatica TaxID=28930 RepID=A0A2N9IZN8_FAGSY
MREIVARMVKSRHVAHPSSSLPFFFSIFLVLIGTCQATTSTVLFPLVLFSLFLLRSGSCAGGFRLEAHGWLVTLADVPIFLTARLCLPIGGVISSGRGCSEENGFGVFFHIKLFSSTHLAVPEDVRKEAYQATEGTKKKLKCASTSSGAKESKITSTSISKTKKDKIVTQGKEEYMAEIFLNDIVDRLVANAFSLATELIGLEWGFKEELRNLVEILFKIKFMLHDAQKRQVSDEPVRIWLTEA